MRTNDILVTSVADDPNLITKPTLVWKVAAKQAASMISAYRTHTGLSAVTVEPALMHLAEGQARAVVGSTALTVRPRRRENEK